MSALAREGVIAARHGGGVQDRIARRRARWRMSRRRAPVEMRIKRDGIDRWSRPSSGWTPGSAWSTSPSRAGGARADRGTAHGLSPAARRDRQAGPAHRAHRRPSHFKLGRRRRVLPGPSRPSGKTGVATAPTVGTTRSRSRRVFPQVKEGRFTIELLFTGDAPAGHEPGQSAETRLTLGEPTPASAPPNDVVPQRQRRHMGVRARSATARPPSGAPSASAAATTARWKSPPASRPASA